MERYDIVAFWSQMTHPTADGSWVHPLDEPFFKSARHSFNLQFPVSPYVGNILDAGVIILGANAGFDPIMTASEFPDPSAIAAYVSRVGNPQKADWSFVSRYYDKTNYGNAVASGLASLINASPYRSRKISEEPDNRLLIEKLPSTQFHRRWLREAILPLARDGSVRIAAKRYGLWKMTAAEKLSPGVYVDKAPVSPLLTGAALAALNQ